jgi:hypothetical protein
MIRKLKPLKQILAENPDYEFNGNGDILMKYKNIGSPMFRVFGGEVDVSKSVFHTDIYIDHKGRQYHESWFEPIKEKVQYYQVMYRNVDGDLFVCNQLVKSKEQFEKKFKALKLIQLIPCGEPVDE